MDFSAHSHLITRRDSQGGSRQRLQLCPGGGFSGPMGRHWLRIQFNRNKNPRSRVLIRIIFFFCSVLSFRGVLSEADTAMMRYNFFLTGLPLCLAAASPLKTNPRSDCSKQTGMSRGHKSRLLLSSHARIAITPNMCQRLRGY